MISIPQTPYDLQQHNIYSDEYQHFDSQTTTAPSTTTCSKNRTTNFRLPTAELNSANLSVLAQGGFPTDHMLSDSWGSLAHYNPDTRVGRFPHQRESSLSSMGSTGPASPYNHNTSNPHIAITDSTTDELSDMHAQDGTGNQGGAYYQLSKSVAGPYTGYQNLDQPMSNMAYPLAIPGPSTRPRIDRSNLLPAPELSTGSRSRPASVASSIAGDSPATPTVGSDENIDKRSKDGYGNVPKLDRTMTDVYSDELYSPNFAITSTPPSHAQLSTVSPPSDIFSQRLNAANSQHLSVSHSPNSSVSRSRSSPFRSGSPYMSAGQDFGSSSNGVVSMNTATQVREQNKARQDAQIFQQQMARSGNEPDTPKTISPKDAVLEFNETDGDAANFPLFPQQSVNMELEHFTKGMMHQPVDQQFINPVNSPDQFNYLAPQMGAGNYLPQQYPYVARSHPSNTNSPPRLSSSDSSSSSAGSTPGKISRPTGVTADGGTYTCTYHGCTLRFETPALLQKHKREGHRQHGIVGSRTQDLLGMSPTYLNSQAGPHRCDRINPSTGKPCSTVFSRPYDLTRHEDTIHNARKQKVHCDLCTEEKTFSRADALTRHYRVCHPDMEPPGKNRRRAAR